jgi:bacillithiol biosynthesis deacetylase BshB1
MKLDILVMASHPDDAELGCGGTIAKHITLGYKVGILDFTRGELGTRGTVDVREKEATKSAEILRLSARENLNLRDGFFQNCEADQLKVISAVRKYKPDIVLANAVEDRHPDHGKGASLAYDSCFLSGLAKIKTKDEAGREQEAWRPKAVYHYIQSEFVEPDLIVDVSEFWEAKMRSILAFKSQFHDPSNTEPETYISSPAFLKKLESRAIDFGHAIGVTYGEGFLVRRFPGIQNLFDLL